MGCKDNPDSRDVLWFIITTEHRLRGAGLLFVAFASLTGSREAPSVDPWGELPWRGTCGWFDESAFQRMVAFCVQCLQTKGCWSGLLLISIKGEVLLDLCPLGPLQHSQGAAITSALPLHTPCHFSLSHSQGPLFNFRKRKRDSELIVGQGHSQTQTCMPWVVWGFAWTMIWHSFYNWEAWQSSPTWSLWHFSPSGRQVLEVESKVSVFMRLCKASGTQIPGFGFRWQVLYRTGENSIHFCLDLEQRWLPK